MGNLTVKSFDSPDETRHPTRRRSRSSTSAAPRPPGGRRNPVGGGRSASSRSSAATAARPATSAWSRADACTSSTTTAPRATPAPATPTYRAGHDAWVVGDEPIVGTSSRARPPRRTPNRADDGSGPEAGGAVRAVPAGTSATSPSSSINCTLKRHPRSRTRPGRWSGVVAMSQLGRSVLATSVAGRNPGRKLGTILHFELPQDARDMSLYRLARQEQRAHDVRVGGAAHDEVRFLLRRSRSLRPGRSSVWPCPRST